MKILVIMMVEDSGNYLMIITPHSGQVSVHIENLNNKSHLDQIEDDPVCRRLSQSRGSEFDTPWVHDNLFGPLWVFMHLPVPEHMNLINKYVYRQTQGEV